MKKTVTIIAICLLSLSILRAQKKSQNIVPGAAGKPGAPMPEIQLKSVTGKMYASDDFKDQHNLFVFLFNPTCGHCIHMGELVSAHQQVFSDNHVIFMASPQTASFLPRFIKTTGLEEYPDIVVGIDSGLFISQVYTYSTLPQINIYDENRVLIKVFHGDTPIDSLRAYAR